MPDAATILWADDDANDVLLMRRAFQKTGSPHRLIHVPDGQDAVDYLMAQPSTGTYQGGRPDLLMLDLKMPRMGGLEVLAWLQTRPELKSFPVVMLSSSDREADISEARALGASEYLVKPCGSEGLVELVRSLDARWLNPARI